MNKDTIYIDIEDDITSIIEKVKSSPAKVVALVPPKGNAVMQSVVNLKLLKRASDTSGKQTVIVTSNQALQALSGGLGLYVAKNLQSKPMLPSDSEADVLPDEDVEVSDPAGALDTEEAGEDVEDLELTDDELAELESEDGTGSVSLADATKKSAKADKKKKVPNFDSFRKKLLIGGAIFVVVLLVLVLVFGRAKAKVVIRAETTPVDVQFDATVDTSLAQSDPAAAKIKALPQEQKKTITQSFTPTGQKDLGTKASGTMKFINCNKDDKLSDTVRTVPAGTGVSSGGKTFITGSSVQVEPSSYVGNTCSANKQSSSVDVTAQNAGDSFNLSSRDYTVSGFSSMTGKGSQMTGGTSRIVKVVTQDDINKATEQMKQQDTAAVKVELTKAFPGGTMALDDSFAVTLANVASEPGVDQEANEARLTAEATYSILGIKEDDLSNAMNLNVVSQMTNPSQQSVYDNGFKTVKMTRVSGNATSAVYTVESTAQYGPEFDTAALAEDIAGDKVGEARSTLQSLPGVKSVEIDLSPFWSSTLPNADRIDIKIDVDKTVSG